MMNPPQIRQTPPARQAPEPTTTPSVDRPVFVASELTDSVAARVQDILASAYETAESVREQAAAATRDMIAQAQATVDRDTERIRRDVEARAAQYLAECHRRVDAFADARVRRLRELSDSLIEQTDALNGRFDQVVRLQEQLDGLIASLGGAAEQTAREAKRPAISLPTVAQFHGESGGLLRDRGAPVQPASAPGAEPALAATATTAEPGESGDPGAQNEEQPATDDEAAAASVAATGSATAVSTAEPADEPPSGPGDPAGPSPP